MSEEKHSLEAGQFEPQRQNMISRMLGKYVDNGRNTNYQGSSCQEKPNIFFWQHCKYLLTCSKVFMKQPSMKSYLIKFLSILLFQRVLHCYSTPTNSVLLSLLFGDFPWKCSLDGDVVRLEVSNPLIPNGAFSLMVRERLLGGLLAA